MHLPAIARAEEIRADDARVRPVKKLERKIFVGNSGAAHAVVQPSTGDFRRSTAGDVVKTRIIRAKPQLQSLARISENVTNDWPVLHQVERHDRRVLAELAAQIDLLF